MADQNVKLTVEEENKLLRHVLLHVMHSKGVEMSNNARQNLCHIAGDLNLPKEKVLKFGEEILVQYIQGLMNPKKGGH